MPAHTQHPTPNTQLRIMKKHFSYYIVWMALLLTNRIFAATSFLCDFESLSEQAAWQLNVLVKPAALENQWKIGRSGQFGIDGIAGLYVSSSNTDTALYAATEAMFVLAYRDLELEQGTYMLTLDYRLLGTADAQMKIWWLPQDVLISSRTGSSTSPDWTKESQGAVCLSNGLYGDPVWNGFSASFTINSSNSKGRLVLVWESAKGVVNPPSACVDNIQICPEDLCDQPTTLAYTNSALSWLSTAPRYEVCMSMPDWGYLTPIDTMSSCTWSPALPHEGYGYFYVRGLCDNGYHTAWTRYSQYIYEKGKRCLEYLDLDAAKCYYGPYNRVTDVRNRVTKMDMGYRSIKSHHTIHYIAEETDPRTLDRLKTIPDGEVASVRLGNWFPDDKINGEGAGEAIEYKYEVVAGSSDIMVLNYAIVMECPTHGNDPMFQLEILDSYGQQIEPADCFSANFAPKSAEPEDLEGWTLIKDEEFGAILPEGVIRDEQNTPIIWKDWTKVSISLRDYVGQTLIIRFTTKDCLPAVHWAYAYFTIGCETGAIKGIGCGNYDTDTISAPEGFYYKWYKETAPETIISTENYIVLDKTDADIYIVELLPKTGTNCSFKLTADPNPHFPIALAEVDTIYSADCQQIVQWKNRSYAYAVRRDNDETYVLESPLSDVLWDFGDGSPIVSYKDSVVRHTYSAEGGQFAVTAVAILDDGACTDTMRLPAISLRDIRNDALPTEEIRLCAGEAYELPESGGVVATQDTLYHWYERTDNGCEQQHSIALHFLQVAYAKMDTTLCEGERLQVGDNMYTNACKDTITLVSSMGCDSAKVYLSLRVRDSLSLEMQPTVTVCADDKVIALPYSILQGEVGEVQVEADSWTVEEEAILIPIDTMLRAGRYPVTVLWMADSCGNMQEKVVDVEVRYSNKVIMHMDGILALYAKDYNGGYDWQSFQWYCDGEKMDGETASYIYLDLDCVGREYYCLITDMNGVSIPTCPLIYNRGMTGISESAIDALGQDGRWYDILGRRVQQPAAGGVYILVQSGKIRKVVH